jgi:hypothetical protein
MRRPANWTSLVLFAALGTMTLLLARRLFRPKPLALPAATMPGFGRPEPAAMLWAWETPEDLTALDPTRTGVAFLAREVLLTPQLTVRPRRQPLRLAPNTWLMAVVRIEVLQPQPDTPELRQELLAAILPAAQLPNVRALQIDFDATTSQLPLYAHLLRELRTQLPRAMPLSITALTSWCGPQSWLPPLAGTIDEAVPMFFRMGGTPALRATLPKDTSHITQPLCAGSAGVATDETWPPLHSHERVYIFRSGPWTPDDLQRLNTSGPTALTPSPAPQDTP